MICKLNSQAMITGPIFQDWFYLHFILSVKQYCQESNSAFKALIILDNAPEHSQALQEVCSKNKLLFLAPNIVPANAWDYVGDIQAVLFKEIMHHAIQAPKDNISTLKEFWKS